jgi:hypothetical protein
MTEILMPGQGPAFPQRDTELDDEIVQILARHITDNVTLWNLRNEICGAIAARGYDIFARPPKEKP